MRTHITAHHIIKTTAALFAVAAALLAILAALAPEAKGAERNGPPVGQAAPAFSLPDTHGEQHALSEFGGRITVLNFWAFWCDTWKAELPSLRELANRQDELGFRLAAVSVDGSRYPEFQRLTHDSFPFPMMMDVGGKVSRQYAIGHVPTVVVIDPAGVVRYTHYGYPGNDAVLSVVRRIASERTRVNP
jgi:peroxiredoxin